MAFAREARRVAGADDSSESACYGLQDIRDLARRLQASNGPARLADLAWNEYRAGRLSSGQVSDRCRDGGELDLDGTGPWP